MLLKSLTGQNYGMALFEFSVSVRYSIVHKLIFTWTWKISFQLGVFYLLVGERNNNFSSFIRSGLVPYEKNNLTVWKNTLDFIIDFLLEL